MLAFIELYRESALVKYLVWGGVALSILGLFAWDQQSRGGAKATAKIERKADALGNNASKAQAAVPSDGASERLRKRYCPDCR